MLETSRADAHKSGVSMQRAANTPTTSTPCVFLHRPCAPGTRSSQMSFTPDPGCSSGRRDPGPGRRSLPLHGLQDLHLKPLRSSPRDGTRRCVLGDSFVRHVRATLAEGKVHSLTVSLVLVFLMFLRRYPRS